MEKINDNIYPDINLKRDINPNKIIVHKGQY